MTRRNLAAAGFVLGATLGFVNVVWAQGTPAAPIRIEPLKSGVYWIPGGSGANSGLIIGRKQAAVIDAKMTEDSIKTLLAEVRKLTPDPVTHVILTHSDSDHVNGLSGYPKGLPIIAHANAKKDMEQAFSDPKLAALRAYLPTETTEGGRTLDIGGIRVNLLHFGPAHTNGDLVVFLPDQKIAFIGDLAFVGRDPLIHRHKNGNSFGLVETLTKILALDADTYIAGHTDPLTKADLKTLQASIQEKQTKIKEMIAQGRSLDEIKKAFGVADSSGRFPSLVENIHYELTKK